MQKNGLYKNFSCSQKWLPPFRNRPRVSATLLFLLFLLTFAWIYSSWTSSAAVPDINEAKLQIRISKESREAPKKTEHPLSFSTGNADLPKINETKMQISSISKERRKATRKTEYPLTCSAKNENQTCNSSNYPNTFTSPASNVTCPEYFRWIHEDLKPFMSTGITRDMVERAQMTAHFRLVIIKGKVYVEKYKNSIQTRDLFTIWGIVQLLRRYPGKLPDLELMFDCNDRPVVNKRVYRGANTAAPPPLFRYCGDQWNLDIVFPDWSFWGWAEINIRPWEKLLREIRKGNKKIKWADREPYAYWKGNPFVAETRQDLLNCNVTEKDEWNARLFIQDWIKESQQAFKESNVANQCNYRYKIYIEGYAWSVSEKYILACDSPTLLVNTNYYDFFLRHLQPVQHYWPIKHDDKCRSIKFAVDWGNNHKQKAQAIGKAASSFVLQELKMNFVYDYMFHLLNEYAKLLRFEPVIPEGAGEVCSEAMACQADGNMKKFMMESLVKSPSTTSPCTLPPPYDPKTLGTIRRRKANSMKQVENWERNFWEAATSTKV